ncbi:unnamed protein product, partial [Didymodactylos carnosus]
MRRIRASKVVNMEVDSTSSSNITDQNLNTSMHGDDDVMKCYFITQMESLISLMKNTLCIGCSNRWNGSLSIERRDGLYLHLVFTCSSCGNVTDLHSSPKLQDTRRYEVNVRLAIGGTLSGIGHSGVKKLLGVMNLPAPVDEEYYSKTQTYIIDHVSRAQQESMAVAVNEAVLEGGGNKQLTVSGDGAWLTRGHTSAHGVAALCSTARCPKILDTNWLSKRCSKCQGSESLRQQDPELFEMFKETHDCQINYEGASGSMEKELIHQMFCRSVSKYDVKYTSFIGDGDAKVHKYLLENPPYSDVKIKKIEDVNHFAKHGKKLHGKGRMTDGQAIKFKIYFGKAIRENKSNLDNMYKRSWAIFKHRYSTNDEPMHEWCQYLQAAANGQTSDHSKSSIPRPCLDMIKPAFDELCSRESLERVVEGGSQNANEAFHSLLWTMVPKHRYWSSTIIRIALGLSAMVFNDGY